MLSQPLDTELYIKPPPRFLENPVPIEKPGSFPGLRIQKALYGLKQVGRMWYQRLQEFLLGHGFMNDPALPCVFISRKDAEFVVVAAYVDDLNLIGTENEIERTISLLQSEFKMKLVGPTTLCLGLQVEHQKNGSLFLHQIAYTRKILKRFDMDKATPLSAPMIGRSKTSDDPYSPSEEEEQEVDKSNYLAAVGAFLYLSTYTTPDISFSVSVLARHSEKPGVRR